jgi:hypothetical protein
VFVVPMGQGQIKNQVAEWLTHPANQIMRVFAKAVGLLVARRGLFGLLTARQLVQVLGCRRDLGLCSQVEPITAHQRGRVLLGAFDRQMSVLSAAKERQAGLARVKCLMSQLLH